MNPLDYLINSGDKAYIITSNSKMVSQFVNLTEEDIEKFKFFVESYDEELLMKGKEILISKFNLLNNKFQKEQLNLKMKLGKKYNAIINLYEDPNFCYNKNIKNHLILIGLRLEDIKTMITEIRKYSSKPIIVFSTQSISNEFFFETILKNAEQCQVFYAYGDYSDIEHLEILNIRDSFKIIIFSDQEGDFFQDIGAIQIYRKIIEIFPLANIIIELNNKKSINFLDKRPFHKDVPFCYWPLPMLGKTFFSHLTFTSFNSSYFYNIGDILAELINVTNVNTKKTSSINDILRGSSEFRQNDFINTIDITKEIEEEIKYYGNLQYILMNQEIGMLALGMVKKGNQNFIDYYEALSLDVFFVEKIDVYNWENHLILFNPSVNESLKEGDKVFVIGTHDYEWGIQRKSFLNKSKSLIKSKSNLGNVDLIDRNKFKNKVANVIENSIDAYKILLMQE